jgi:type IV secretion system protein VirB9
MSFALALMLAQATPALPGDPRLITVPWRDNAVVRLIGHAGVEATVILANDEHIENVAIGDANAWQVTPNRRANMLFLKPLGPRARTNLTVVTDRRTYFFDLVAAPGTHAIYGLRLAYPEEPKKPVPPAPAAPLTTEEAALAHGAPAAAPVDPATLDTTFTLHGAKELLPARVFGDGQATYIAWPKGVLLPAILGRNDRGVEGPINYAMHDDMIVVEGTPDMIVLRTGKLVATIEHPHHTLPQVKTP